ncbi:MAG TPA: hypothetical protein VFK05_25710 [Polyangiaceae bacterium]|nr:hypothetical protein [Polyangiaceae bacterium]
MDRVLGGLLVVGLLTACGGGSHAEGQAGSAGGAGSGNSAGSGGLSSAGANAGNAGTHDGTSAAAGQPEAAGAAGEAGADDGAAGAGGNAGAGGRVGSGGLGGAGGPAAVGGNSSIGGGSATGGYPAIDIGEQKTSDKLDVLFVIDNSISMADKQHLLSTSLPSFVSRLANPWCVDAQGKPVATQPLNGAMACSSGTRERPPVNDLHLGVITSSLGSHGGDVCATASSANEHPDDHGMLLPTQRSNLPSYNNSGYLVYNPTGETGVANITSVIADLQTIVNAGESGCGYEAPLEAMYRFLVDPEPPSSVEKVNGVSTPTAVNDALLAQRKAFLRPDSAVAIVILSDENDCSIRDDSVGWFVGSQTLRMPRSTTACDSNPNDPCCRSCALIESLPPGSCQLLSADANCKAVTSGQSYATWDVLHDSLNLRCFAQQKRFGFDLLYPIERYSDALSNPKVRNRAQALVDNPLLAARDGKGPRSATLISVSLIVGAPWQDLAATESLSSGPIRYLDGAALESNGRWPLLLGNRALNLPPSDPFMIESSEPRAGQNPLTQTPIVSYTSTNPTANVINGHEQNIPQLDDLQFSCTFPLFAPRTCLSGDPACDCAPDKQGKLDALIATNTPLCQPPGGGAVTNTQYFGKGYPGTRELGFAKLLGARAVPASICPRTLSDENSPDFAYNPAFSALLTRIGATLK